MFSYGDSFSAITKKYGEEQWHACAYACHFGAFWESFMIYMRSYGGQQTGNMPMTEEGLPEKLLMQVKRRLRRSDEQTLH